MTQRIKRLIKKVARRVSTERPLGHPENLAQVHEWLKMSEMNRLVGRV